ncbi:hypothetical protein AVEN_30317-1 [Araneus ventricosus]|uniref:Uncharacterized protein n=1 Tax=Araneus ventricosus TaxID=182803 RepID=A0A4Y2NHY8_ARAVE|nr:hypothetical protein AVEN_30317-1 [Araneus ventricosus]
MLYCIWYIKSILPNFPNNPNSPESEQRSAQFVRINRDSTVYLVTAVIAVRRVKPFEVGRERSMFTHNLDLSLPTSKGFTRLTAITAVVVELARHFTMPRSVFMQCLGIRGSQRQTSNKDG